MRSEGGREAWSETRGREALRIADKQARNGREAGDGIGEKEGRSRA